MVITMTCLHYSDDELFIEKVSLESISAHYGTPCYVYSKQQLLKNWHLFSDAFHTLPHRICYAVKANSNLAILNLLAEQNAGFDIVSLGELKRVLAAGGDPQKIIFSGVGKTQLEIEAAIQSNIYCFNVESEPELERLQACALAQNKNINISLRINPNINPKTHAHISTGLKENKFGIDTNNVIALCQQIKNFSHLNLIGLACHIGSQIIELEPFSLAIDHLLNLYNTLKSQHILLKHLNIGGGLGITYRHEQPPPVKAYAELLQQKCAGYPIEIIIEPGRAMVGNAGILLTKIEYLKHTAQKNFIIVDAGMNDLLRPALYNAWQSILPVKKHKGVAKLYDIAGPVCESADFLGKDRELIVQTGDLLAIDCAGAYGFSMSSNYNSRARPCEVLVDNDQTYLIRAREKITDLFHLENIPH